MSRPTLIVTDALTGLQTIHFEHGSPIILGVPLCVYCDRPLTGDHCHDCDEHVDLAEAREYAEKLARFVYETGME